MLISVSPRVHSCSEGTKSEYERNDNFQVKTLIYEGYSEALQYTLQNKASRR